MNKDIHRDGRDPRYTELAIAIALLAFVIAACEIVSETSEMRNSPTAIGTSVRW